MYKLKKAFYTVDHVKLLEATKAAGLWEQLSCEYNPILNKTRSLNQGLPQGSVLLPILLISFKWYGEVTLFAGNAIFCHWSKTIVELINHIMLEDENFLFIYFNKKRTY